MGIYLKFGVKKHIEDMLFNGTIYCKDINYFTLRDIKDIEDGRWDFDELVTLMEFSSNGFMQITPINKPDQTFSFRTTKFHYKEHITEAIGNLFCLFDLDPKNYKKNKDYYLDQRLAKFGSHFLLIHNSPEFARRVTEKLKENGIEFVSKNVEYKDFSKFTGKKTIFQKDLKYEYQSEVRLVLNTGLKVPYKFSIGNIEDIAVIYTSDNLKVMNGGKVKKYHMLKFFK